MNPMRALGGVLKSLLRGLGRSYRDSRTHCMRLSTLVFSLLLFSSPIMAQVPGGVPSTTRNNDSCDIGVYPSATLLLPYFEVDIRPAQAQRANTLFTLVDVTAQPRIARVTLWTDLNHPVLTFNVFLGGYDVQGFSMYDILGRGVIATTNAGTNGVWSYAHETPFADVGSCDFGGNIPAALLRDVQAAFTLGTSTACSKPIGMLHTLAMGYATIDVVANCSSRSPDDPEYFTRDLLFDNVLTGDFQLIEGPYNFAGDEAKPRLSGASLVHIRAIPEGGAPGSRAFVNLPRTFYDAYAPERSDRRQPLPSVFAARFITEPRVGNARVLVWREAPDKARGCETSPPYPVQAPNYFSARFDENENPTTINPGCRITCTVIYPWLPGASLWSVDTASTYPPDFAGTNDAGGWLYLNLNDPTDETRQQGWVMTLLQSSAGNTFLSAAAMGNGCSPTIPPRAGRGAIAPLP